MPQYRYSIKKFIKDWMLVIAMTSGASMYLIYHSSPWMHPAGPFLLQFCKIFQPVSMFAMLFLSFCKIEPNQIRPHKWMLPLLAVQSVFFIGPALLLAAYPDMPWKEGMETFMLCMIAPTAASCTVVTGKLGGSMSGVISYTVLINLAVSILVPLFIPLVNPDNDINFISAFYRILGKVFPLLIMPCLSAWLVRYYMPKFHAFLMRYPDLSFDIWSVCLTVAILMSTRFLVNSDASWNIVIQLAAASLLACAFQFWTGHKIGNRYGCRISAGQSLAQKNTVFSIWMAYTFLNPVISVAGGFYSIWHNSYNAWQLYKRRKELEKENAA